MNQLSAQVLSAIDKGKKIRELIVQMHNRSGVGLRAFARQLGITPTTLVKWKEGKGNPEANNLRKIALRSGRTLANLEDYLEGRLSLEEYLDGSPERSLPIEDVLKSLPYYSLKELAIILQSVSQQMVMKSQSTESGSRGVGESRLQTPDLPSTEDLPTIRLRTSAASVAKEWELIAFTEDERLRLSSLVERSLKEAGLDCIAAAKKFNLDDSTISRILTAAKTGYPQETLERVATLCGLTSMIQLITALRT